VKQYRDGLLRAGAAGLAGRDFSEFLRWFDLIGLQRHLKVLGIFARLNWRDGKSGYLDDLPRTLDYVLEASALFPELRDLRRLLVDRVAPNLVAANARAKGST
ncbi:MAG: hypothetical protein ABW136_05295, partial [Steroidobacteraceae bacterium]